MCLSMCMCVCVQAPVLKEGYLERESTSGLSRQKQWKRKYVFVCVCACVRVCRVCARMRACICTLMLVRERTRACVRACVRVCAHVCVRARVRPSVYRSVRVCAHAQACMLAHTYCPTPPRTRFVVLTSLQIKYYETQEDFEDGMDNQGVRLCLPIYTVVCTRIHSDMHACMHARI